MREKVAKKWDVDVDRGPGWVFVRLHQAHDERAGAPALAENLREIMQRHMSKRIVVELDQLALMRSSLIGQLLLLSKRVRGEGGLLRLAGLSEQNQQVLSQCQLKGRLGVYPNRSEAVLGASTD